MVVGSERTLADGIIHGKNAESSLTENVVRELLVFASKSKYVRARAMLMDREQNMTNTR